MATYIIIALMLSASTIYGLSGEKKTVNPDRNQK
jgi:hypothetical protein